MSIHPPMHSPCGFRTTSLSRCGEAHALALCLRLVHASQWFSVLPLPDDEWEITVKEENTDRLQAWCAAGD